MRPIALGSILVLVAGCNITEIDGSSIEYRGPLAGVFRETYPYPTNPEGPPYCATYSTLSGTVRVKLAKQGEIDGADAGVDITERVVGASAGCGSSRAERPFGEWTAPISGTLSQFGFSMTRSNSGQTTRIDFTGSLTNDVIVGAMTFTRTQGDMTGTTTFNVSLPVAQPVQIGVGGTWTGQLMLTMGGNTLARATVLALTQSGSRVTGQLQFAGEETLTIDGRVAGSTLALTATPLQVGDGCDRHSFGLIFVVDEGQMNATAATGIACFDGGATLHEFTSASGRLAR